MVIKIPFDEEKTDVQLSFERYNKSLSEEEKRSLDILADYFTYISNWNFGLDAKRNEEKKKELLKAVENSTKTYEEIMAFICSEDEIN